MYIRGTIPHKIIINKPQLKPQTTMSQQSIQSCLSFEEDICGNFRPLGANHPNHGSLQRNSNATCQLVSSITGGIKGPLATSDSLGWSNADLGCNPYEASSLETPKHDTNKDKMDLDYQGKFLKGRRIVQNEMVKAKADEKAEPEAEEAKANAEAETKAKGKEEHDTFYLLQYRLVDVNTNMSNLMFENGIFNIQTFERFKERRTSVIRILLFHFNDQVDQTRRSMLSKLLQTSIYGLQKAEFLYKKWLSDQMCKTEEQAEAYDIIKSKYVQCIRNTKMRNDIKSERIQGITTQEEQKKEEVYNLISQLLDLNKLKQTQVITTQDDKSSEEQAQTERGGYIYSLMSQLIAIIKSKQTQGIITKEQEQVEGYDSIKLEQAQDNNKQDSKSEVQQQGEEYNVIKPEKAQDGKSEDQQAYQQVDQETDQQAAQQGDQNRYQNADQETDQEADQETAQQAYQQAEQQANQETHQKADQQAVKKAVQETDQEEDQKADQETDPKAYKKADQEIDQEVDQEVYQEVGQQAYQQEDQENQAIDQEEDQEEDQETDQEADQETDPWAYQEVDQEADQEAYKEKINKQIKKSRNRETKSIPRAYREHTKSIPRAYQEHTKSIPRA